MSSDFNRAFVKCLLQIDCPSYVLLLTPLQAISICPVLLQVQWSGDVCGCPDIWQWCTVYQKIMHTQRWGEMTPVLSDDCWCRRVASPTRISAYSVHSFFSVWQPDYICFFLSCIRL